MQSNFKFVVGIDISKQTFDACISEIQMDSKMLVHKVFANNRKGFTQLVKWLATLAAKMEDTLFCMENTGIYHRSLASFLYHCNSCAWVETPSQIKWSAGIQRGKNDKVDSQRIMKYARRNIDSVKRFEDRDKDIQQLADLLALRQRLQESISKLKVPIKELRSAGQEEQANVLDKLSRGSIKSLTKDLKQLDVAILSLIEKSKKLSETYTYVTSVKSVGFVAACYLLVYTDCFTRFKTAKQIASYCGIAPFEYSSGSSIRGRTKVSHLANKNLKTILHMCAISSLAHNDEMKTYAARKVAEGKNKMLVLNAIRNKLLSRVFSCVKNKKMYVPYAAA